MQVSRKSQSAVNWLTLVYTNSLKGSEDYMPSIFLERDALKKRPGRRASKPNFDAVMKFVGRENRSRKGAQSTLNIMFLILYTANVYSCVTLARRWAVLKACVVIVWWECPRTVEGFYVLASSYQHLLTGHNCADQVSYNDFQFYTRRSPGFFFVHFPDFRLYHF